LTDKAESFKIVILIWSGQEIVSCLYSSLEGTAQKDSLGQV